MGKDHSRISALPDDILVNILDRLDVRDAAITSILSRRWSQLAAKLSRLIINAQDFAPEGVSRMNVSVDDLVLMNAAAVKQWRSFSPACPGSCPGFAKNPLLKLLLITKINQLFLWAEMPSARSLRPLPRLCGLASSATAVKATKSILARRNRGEHTIRLLSTAFYLIDDVPISIGLLVGNAMATHLVEMAKFSVMTEKVGLNNLDDDDLVSYGREFMRFFDACPKAFGGLTSLDLENLRFGESDISNVIITCKRLKHLRLFNCDSGDPSTLEVEHSHLTELSIVCCLFEQVKLNWLPQLTQMVFDDWIGFQDPLVLGHAPLLEAVSLTNVARSFHRMVKLSEFLGGTSIRDLKLDFKSEKIWVQPECPTICVPPTKVWDHACVMVTDEERRKKELYSEKKGQEWESASAGFQHHSLVTLVIFGFESADYLVSYVRRVMAAAVNLEDVFLYSRLECDHCQDTKPDRFPWTKRQRISLKKRITMGIESFAIIHSSGKLRADHLSKIVYPECSLLEAKKKW